MKILIIGSEKQWAIENFYITYLRNYGADVSFFPAHDLFEDYYHQSILHKLSFRSGLSRIYKTINSRLIELANETKLDIIWVFKGMEIHPKTLQQLSRQGTKLVNYNCDHPFIHTFRGSGNAYVTQSVGCYDAHFCYSIPVLQEIENKYQIPCTWLPFAYEPLPFEFPDEKNEIKKICFIGNPDSFRAEMITELNSQGIPIDVFGNRWGKFIKPSENLQIYPAIYKSDFNQIAPRYRLHLNLFRPHNDNSHNMRTFEMPGLGCIVLAPDSHEHRLLYKANQEIFLYKNISEMAMISKKILSLTYMDALKIRQAAYNRTNQSGYTYKARSKQVYECLQQIIEGSFQFSGQRYKS